MRAGASAQSNSASGSGESFRSSYSHSGGSHRSFSNRCGRLPVLSGANKKPFPQRRAGSAASESRGIKRPFDTSGLGSSFYVFQEYGAGRATVLRRCVWPH